MRSIRRLNKLEQHYCIKEEFSIIFLEWVSPTRDDQTSNGESIEHNGKWYVNDETLLEKLKEDSPGVNCFVVWKSMPRN